MNPQTKLKWWQNLPGILATGIVLFVNGMWAAWGLGEMFYEGWYGSWGIRLAYLSIFAAIFLLTLIALRWPRMGGTLLIIIGAGFALWWWGKELFQGTLTWEQFFEYFILSGILVVAGLLFWWDARVRKIKQELGLIPTQWWRRNLRFLIALGIPLIITVGMLAANLPIVLSRVDDGIRTERAITGSDGVTLVWASAGPGWNWKQSWGGFPSWQSIALYGQEPVGIDNKTHSADEPYATQAEFDQYNLCRYLSTDGLTAMDTPQDIWRMATVSELVHAFSLHNENAGCTWNGELGLADCTLTPDKETPLWAPDEAPVYYWAYEEYDEDNAYYVSYNGYIKRQPKGWGNPRHGYRCVREP